MADEPLPAPGTEPPVDQAAEPLPSESAPERWRWMFEALRVGYRVPDPRGRPIGEPGLDLERRQSDAYARAAVERQYLLDVAIEVLFAKHRRRP